MVVIDKIQIKNIDQVYNRVICEPGIQAELSDSLTFFAANYKFHPKFRARIWDGKIRLLHQTGRFYHGLNYFIEEFAKDRGYEVEHLSDFSQEEFSLKEAEEFCKSLNLPLEVRDYQLKTFVRCVREKRALVLSPTASGKSLIIYLLTQYYGGQCLIIVPQIGLVTQMAGDFKDYGYKHPIQEIYGGQDKKLNEMICISTWQSLYKNPKKFFDDFDLIIVDEAHQAKAVSITKIMENTPNCEHKFGFTGTIDDSLTNKLTLEGLFGKIIHLTTTEKLQKEGHLAQLKIKCVELKYADEYRKLNYRAKYEDEVAWLLSHQPRNEFIKNLVLSLKGNTLLLFRFVDKHGVPLYNIIQKEAKIPVYYVAGAVPADDREQIRKVVDTHEDSITVASMGVFSQGINIIHINNIVLATPIKSKIRILQSIGRGLRKSEKKKTCTLIDVADDLIWKNRDNHTISHYKERVSLYAKEMFQYKIYKVKIK